MEKGRKEGRRRQGANTERVGGERRRDGRRRMFLGVLAGYLAPSLLLFPAILPETVLKQALRTRDRLAGTALSRMNPLTSAPASPTLLPLIESR